MSQNVAKSMTKTTSQPPDGLQPGGEPQASDKSQEKQAEEQYMHELIIDITIE